MGRIEKETKPWSRSAKVFIVLLALAAVCAGVYFYRNKPMTLVQTENVDQNSNPKTGEIVDFAYAYNAAQDKELSPPEENGWRLILQTLGPLALQQRALVESVPWEEFPTNEKTKEWFEGEWTFLCEKFNLDPHERPTMLDSLWMWGYFAKNGVKGDEPIPEDDKNGKYYENFEEHPARVTELETLDALAAGPWTAEQYPAAARGIEENADLYDVYAKAARSPKFGCWHRVPDSSEGGFFGMLLPDVQFEREIARELQVRANFRVGMGDISGAIDDVETIMLIGRARLESEHGLLVERLVGLACMGIANGIPLMGNPDVPPTAEELSRIAELYSSYSRGGQADRFADLAFRGESRYFCYGAFVDYLKKRRGGLSITKMDPFDESADDLPPLTQLKNWLFLKVTPVNDAKAFEIFKDLCESLHEHSEEVVSYLGSEAKLAAMLRSTPEKNNAIYAASQVFPAFGAAKEAFHRFDCVLKEATIATAFLAYYQEHGTLPPAFTLDEFGRPLHSWRVLILPYLGPQAKALYDQIRLDEPWNSEANAAFHAQIPEFYRCLSLKDAKEGETDYSVLLGDDGLFDESGVGKDFKEIAKRPGRDVWNQFLVVERAQPVCWMKPDAEPKIADFIVGGKADVRKFFFVENLRHTGGMNCVRIGGDVRFYADTTKPDELEALLRGTPAPEGAADGEAETPTAEEPVAEGAGVEPATPPDSGADPT